MFDSWYDYRKVQTNRRQGGLEHEPLCHIYQFFGPSQQHGKIKYIVQVYEYRSQLLVVSFYSKRHGDEIQRFRLKTQEGAANRILSTIFFLLIHEFFHNQPAYSLLVVGAYDFHESERKPSRRIRVYKKLIAISHNIPNFDIIEYTEYSALYLLNSGLTDELAERQKEQVKKVLPLYC